MGYYQNGIPLGYKAVAARLAEDIEPPDLSLPDRWQKLMDGNPWLRKKINRRRRVIEHCRYVADWLPELATYPRGIVVDVGPGLGELLEIAGYFGHEPIGVDAKEGKGGMGDDYLAACRIMHEWRGLNVVYCGLSEFLREANGWPEMEGNVVAINMRGSIEQCFAHLLDGPPHHEHHRADRLVWRDKDEVAEAFDEMFRVYAKWLRDHGVVLIHANGTGTPESQSLYQWALQTCASKNGLELLLSSGGRLHKFSKP